MDKSATLTPQILRIVRDKGTEAAFSGQFQTPKQQGTFLCRQCGLALFRADSQFSSHCGWPSFDDQIENTLLETVDADGRRSEILCLRCEAHLGHVFTGEHMTKNNRRHCVNSLAIEFVSDGSVLDTEEAIVAGGCFWGIEFLLQKIPGVLKTEVGYTGGLVVNPTYHQVCSKSTGHYEATRVVYDKEKCDYLTLLKVFFEIHDPTQTNGQGSDHGEQYHSAVFYHNDHQQQIATAVMDELTQKGYQLATLRLPATIFWPAEIDHQQYYQKNNKQPYCHQRVKRF